MKEVVKGFLDNNKLLGLLFVAALLLALSVAMDYATNVSINNINDGLMEINDSKITVVNNGTVVGLNDNDSIIVPKSTDKIYIDKSQGKVKVKNRKGKTKKKKELPTVTITAKPSVRSSYSYQWYTTTFISYCPHCHQYGTIRNVHKWPARYEQELTCDPRLGGCDADYCGVTGKEKYSWSNYYLQKA